MDGGRRRVGERRAEGGNRARREGIVAVVVQGRFGNDQSWRDAATVRATYGDY